MFHVCVANKVFIDNLPQVNARCWVDIFLVLFGMIIVIHVFFLLVFNFAAGQLLSRCGRWSCRPHPKICIAMESINGFQWFQLLIAGFLITMAHNNRKKNSTVQIYRCHYDILTFHLRNFPLISVSCWHWKITHFQMTVLIHHFQLYDFFIAFARIECLS